jgi:hypothetical protein
MACRNKARPTSTQSLPHAADLRKLRDGIHVFLTLSVSELFVSNVFQPARCASKLLLHFAFGALPFSASCFSFSSSII